jgi:hypothetical protein
MRSPVGLFRLLGVKLPYCDVAETTRMDPHRTSLPRFQEVSPAATMYYCEFGGRCEAAAVSRYSAWPLAALGRSTDVSKRIGILLPYAESDKAVQSSTS